MSALRAINIIQKYEGELENLSKYCGINAKVFPIRSINWETNYVSVSGVRSPYWREIVGELGYIVVMTHDKGKTVISVLKDGTCNVIKGYRITEKGSEVLDYLPISQNHNTIADAISSHSEIFHKLYNPERVPSQPPTARDLKSPNNELVSLPQPVLLLIDQEEEKGESQGPPEPEDDENLIFFSKANTTDQEYWNLVDKLKKFVQNSADPVSTEILEIAAHQYIKETAGFRAVLSTPAITAMRDVLAMRRDQSDTKRAGQAEAVLSVLASISVSPNIRKHLANEEMVNPLFEMIQREEVSKPLTTATENLFKIIANCAHNQKFRQLVAKKEFLQPLITRLQNQSLAPKVTFVLWTLNRSSEAAKMLMEGHLLIELERYVNVNPVLENDELMLNIIRLLHSIALYGDVSVRKITNHQVTYFCIGLKSQNEELVTWAARAFCVFQIPEDLYKLFCGTMNEGPNKIVQTLYSKNTDVVLAGLEVISNLAPIEKIRNELVSRESLGQLKALWGSEDANTIKGVLKVIGVLTLSKDCLEWTNRQNLIPGLLNYLQSRDDDFVVFFCNSYW